MGKPVTAGDAGDILTYTMADTIQSFTIDRATGQIMVGPRIMLDTETAASYDVEVRATDPSGDPDAVTANTDNSHTVTVTINIANVNEAPMITRGLTGTSLEENFDSEPGTIGVQLTVATYMATDQESTANDDELYRLYLEPVGSRRGRLGDH